MTEPEAHLDAEAAGPGPTLAAAKTAVLAHIDQLEQKNALTSDVAADLRARTQQAPSLFALDDEVVFPYDPLKKRFCRWPECFRPPKPADKGKPPAYCADGRDEHGRLHCGDDTPEGQQPDHAQRSRRQRQAKRKGFTETVGREATVEQPGDRPVSLAIATVPIQIEELLTEFRLLGAKVETLQTTAALTVDEEARLAEIETIQIESQTKVDEEKKLRVAAQNKQRELQRAHDRMAGDLELANAAAEEAAAEVEAMRDERNTAVAERRQMAEEAARKVAAANRLAIVLILHAQSVAKWLAAEAVHNAEQQVATAQAAFDSELTKRTTEMDSRVTEADNARKKALQDAANREQEVQRREAAAEQSVADANSAREAATKEANRLRDDNTKLRDAAIEREREHSNATTKLIEKHERETGELRTKLEELATARAQETTAHHNALLQAQADFDTALDRKTAELRAELKETYGTQITLLTERASRAEAELDRLRPAPPTGPEDGGRAHE